MSAFPVLTPTLPPATHTNSYALGEREVLLVEPATPYDDERRAFVEWAQGLRNVGRSLKAILVTHHHVDHIGGATFLSRELGLPLWAHATTQDLLPEIPFARTLCDGEAIYLAGPREQTWQVLHTPGHAAGHLCLFEPRQRTLVVGDMVASVGTILITKSDGDMQLYLEQLERLAILEAELGLPAHGAPIPSPSGLFRYYIAHRLMREARIVSHLTASPQALDELVSKAYSDVSPATWPIAKLSLEAHLIKLVREGRAEEAGSGFRLLT